MYPGKEMKFEEIFSKYVPVIKEIYKRTVTTPDRALLKECNENDGKELML